MSPCKRAGRPRRHTARLLTCLLALLPALVVVGGVPAPAQAAATTQVETFALPSSGGHVVADASASGGAALLIWTTATATSTVAMPATSSIVVRARGQQCAGAPVLQVSVDGALAGTATVASTDWRGYAFTGGWAAGSHTVALSYTNDIASSACDRNLLLDRLVFGPAPPGSVEAERMTLPAGAGGVFADPTASGGAGLLIWSNAAAAATLSGSAGAMLVVTARGDACAGAAVLRLTVDGATVLDSAVSSAGWAQVAASWPGGAHAVQVRFVNDGNGGGCDRNLRVDRVAVTPAPAAARLFGLSSAGPNQGVSTAVATAAALGRHLDVVNVYAAWVWATPLPTATLRAIASAGATPEITWEPWDPRLGASQPAYAPARIAAGAYDGYLTGWAQAAAAYGGPLMLRFGHEMNGTWYPWSPGAGGGSPADYVAAYRHVHDLFRVAGAGNVSWVWSPNIVQGMPTPLAAVYPGPGYVDVIGIDGYNGGTDVPYMGGWRTPQQVFDSTLQALPALAPGVPVILNETGCSEHGGDKAAWITSLFGYLRTTRVTGVLWFDVDTPGQADWRLATSTTSTAAARTALTSW